jgi:hypothetical protein
VSRLTVAAALLALGIVFAEPPVASMALALAAFAQSAIVAAIGATPDVRVTSKVIGVGATALLFIRVLALGGFHGQPWPVVVMSLGCLVVGALLTFLIMIPPPPAPRPRSVLSRRVRLWHDRVTGKLRVKVDG